MADDEKVDIEQCTPSFAIGFALEKIRLISYSPTPLENYAFALLTFPYILSEINGSYLFNASPRIPKIW